MLDLSWAIKQLDKTHDRIAFDCGESELNLYLQQFSSQHTKNNISRTFVAADESAKIYGFYTISAGNINFQNLPNPWQKKIPKYPVPIARIGRLAVDKSMQGQGIGEHLLMDVLNRCALLSKEIGIFGVIVDAKHEKAQDFYLRYGFTILTDLPLTLLMPMKDIIAANLR